MFKNNIKAAWRNLRQNNSTAWLNISGLAVAMAAAILILMWVQNERSYDSYHQHADQIHLLGRLDTNRIDMGYSVFSPYPAIEAIQQTVPGVEMIAVAQPSFYSRSVFEANDHKFHEKNALYVDSNWTKIFDYEVLEGSVSAFERTPYSILLTASKARQYFGTASALSQTVLIDSVPHQVAGVIADIPPNSSFQQDILITNHITLNNERDLSYWGMHSQLLFIKMTAGVQISQAEKDITAIFDVHQPWTAGTSQVSRFIPLTGIHFQKSLDDQLIPKGNPQNIRIFSLLAGLLLITASINFVNLSIARVGVRLKEIGIRKIIGAAKKQLFLQVLAETALSVMLALALAILLTFVALPHFNRFTERSFGLDPSNGVLWLLVGGIFSLVLVLTGIYPALVLTRLKPVVLLKNQGLSGMSRLSFRRVLVGAQLTLAIFMLIGVLVIHRQFSFIQKEVSGYQKEQLFTVLAPSPKEVVRANDPAAVGRLTSSLQTLKTELLASSAVMAVSKVNGVSMLDDGNVYPSDIRWGGYEPLEPGPDMVNIWVDEDYIKVSGLKIKSGRWFDPTNVSDKNNIILNETAVREFGLEEPVIGTTYSGGIPTHSDGGVVIGVVEDFYHKNLRDKIDPVIISLDPFMGHLFLVKAYGGQISRAIADTEAIWKSRFPDEAFSYTFLDEEFDRLYKEDRKALSFSMVIGGLSILIACLGLLGMVISSTQLRVKEIGIRKVLGASVQGITALLSRDFVRLVLIAVVVATPAAWWAMNKWLQNYAYHIELQWWMFAGAGLAVLLIALMTVSWQAVRAAVANPVDSLRDE